MTPEMRVKYQISSWLKLKNFFFWWVDSTGMWDVKKKIFRVNSSPYRIKGVPDIVGILPGGRWFGIEVKRPEVRLPDKVGENGKSIRGKVIQTKGMPSPEQIAFMTEARKRGAVCFVARSIEDVRKELDRYAKPASVETVRGNPLAQAGTREAPAPDPLPLEQVRREPEGEAEK